MMREDKTETEIKKTSQDKRKTCKQKQNKKLNKKDKT